MVRLKKCECCVRYEADINSLKVFEEIKVFFDKQVNNGTFVEEQIKEPYYVWSNGNDHREYYATKWYRCNICGCLWEFQYPDFPARGFVKKYESGIYTGTCRVNSNDDL